MITGRSLGAIFCILFIPLFLTSCAAKRAMVHSSSGPETMIDASKKAINDIGFKAVSKDKEDGHIIGEYDAQNACCTFGSPELVRINIQVKPVSGDSARSEAEVQVKGDRLNIFNDLLMAIKNEVPDAKIVVIE